MKEELRSIEKELNWKEKIILKIFKKTVIKICDIMRLNIMNTVLKK